MINRYFIAKPLIAAAALMGVVACVSDPVFEDEVASRPPTSKIINSSEGATVGRMILYVDDATADAWLAAAEPTRAGTAGLGCVVDELRVESITPLFNLSVNGDVKRERGMHRWFVAEFSDELDVEVAANTFASMPNVERVEYSKSVARPEVHVVPVDEVEATRSGDYPFDDPMLPLQWALDNRGDKEIFSTAVAGEDINAFKAWEYGAGHPDVVVAVIDEGVKYNHPDLAANMWTNNSELNGVEGVDDDGNGYVDDIYGINVIDRNGNISWNNRRYNSAGNYIGDVGHGTHVAGIVAAVNNNGIGISSIAGGTGNGDGVRIMSVQMFRENISAYSESIALGMEYAADMGASILQCSWGATNGRYTYEQMEKDQGSVFEGLRYFIEHGGSNVMDGGVAIFAAGNESVRMAGNPAAHYLCVAVTATAADGLPTYYTNIGPGCNIAAPGGDYEWVDGVLNPKGAILSTVPSETPNPYSDGREYYGSDYGYMTGTSMACPYVTGVAALALSCAAEHGKRLTNEQLVDIIHCSVRDIDSRMSGTKSGNSYSGDAWQIDLDKYRDMMGIGSLDALCAVNRVYDTQTVAAEVNHSLYVKLNENIGDGTMRIKLHDYILDEATIERLGIRDVSKFGDDTLTFICTKPGIGTVTLRYFVGAFIESDFANNDINTEISGMLVEKDFLIIVRDNNDTGGWL